MLKLDIPDSGTGTLLVYLQDLPDQRNRIGIVYHGDNGRNGNAWHVVDDPFVDGVGVANNSSARIGNRGTTVLRSSGGSDVGKPETVAIFMNKE